MKEVSTIFWENGSCDILEEITDVHLISVNLQKKILKNPVFKSTIYGTYFFHMPIQRINRYTNKSISCGPLPPVTRCTRYNFR